MADLFDRDERVTKVENDLAEIEHFIRGNITN
jgi:threonine synthase